MDPVDILLAAAVPAETNGLAVLLQRSQSLRWCQASILEGRYRSLSVVLAATGIGKVNAALVTAALLSRYTPRRVCYFGCAGAYADSPLAVGDVLVIDEVMFADEGVLTRDGPLPMTAVGIPLLYHQDRAVFERCALGAEDPVRSLKAVLPPARYASGEAGNGESTIGPDPLRLSLCPEDVETASGRSFSLRYGPIVSVGMTSGDRRSASGRYRRYRGWAEDMESSGVVQACVRMAVPMLLCRGISNIAGDRDKRHWRMAPAVEHCQALVRSCLDLWAEQASQPTG